MSSRELNVPPLPRTTCPDCGLHYISDTDLGFSAHGERDCIAHLKERIERVADLERRLEDARTGAQATIQLLDETTGLLNEERVKRDEAIAALGAETVSRALVECERDAVYLQGNEQYGDMLEAMSGEPEFRESVRLNGEESRMAPLIRGVKRIRIALAQARKDDAELAEQLDLTAKALAVALRERDEARAELAAEEADANRVMASAQRIVNERDEAQAQHRAAVALLDLTAKALAVALRERDEARAQRDETRRLGASFQAEAASLRAELARYHR